MDENALNRHADALTAFTAAFGWSGSSRLSDALQNAADKVGPLVDAINNHAEVMKSHTDALDANTAAINASLSAQQG